MVSVSLKSVETTATKKDEQTTTIPNNEDGNKGETSSALNNDDLSVQGKFQNCDAHV